MTPTDDTPYRSAPPFALSPIVGPRAAAVVLVAILAAPIASLIASVIEWALIDASHRVMPSVGVRCALQIVVSVCESSLLVASIRHIDRHPVARLTRRGFIGLVLFGLLSAAAIAGTVWLSMKSATALGDVSTELLMQWALGANTVSMISLGGRASAWFIALTYALRCWSSAQRPE